MGWTVAIGVDTHKDMHLAVACDRLGAQVDSRAVAANSAGYRQLWQWASALGEPAFALEGAGSYGAGLARSLEAAGASVYECERPRRQERRRGKSDLIDAALAARQLVRGEGLSRLRGGGRREELRLLLLERRGAVRARTAALNQLQAVVVTAPDRLRERLGSLGGSELGSAARRLPRGDAESPALVAVLRRLGRRVQLLERELGELESGARDTCAHACPRARPGVRRRHRLGRPALGLQRRSLADAERGLLRGTRGHEPRCRLERPPPAPSAQPWR